MSIRQTQQGTGDLVDDKMSDLVVWCRVGLWKIDSHNFDPGFTQPLPKLTLHLERSTLSVVTSQHTGTHVVLDNPALFDNTEIYSVVNNDNDTKHLDWLLYPHPSCPCCVVGISRKALETKAIMSCIYPVKQTTLAILPGLDIATATSNEPNVLSMPL